MATNSAIWAGSRAFLFSINSDNLKMSAPKNPESIAAGLDMEVSELLIKIAAALEPAPVVPVTDSLAA